MEHTWEKIEKTSGCWNWTGHVNSSGYGELYREGKGYRAHRYVYEQLVGPIPKGLQLDHLCRNRRCVRPEHLEPVTRHENILRGISPAAEHARRTHCPKGHPYSGDNLWHRFYKAENAFYRECRECRRQSTRAWRERLKAK